MERLNLLNDYLFLKLMGEKGGEIQCLAFLNAVLGSKGREPAKLVKILENKTFTAEIIGEKTSILDVRVETDAGEKVNIEVQLKDMHNIEKRTLLHWGREFTKSISAGDDYGDLSRVITINIVNFDIIKLKDFHTCFHLREDDHCDYLLTDVLEIHFINMVRFRRLKSRDVVNRPLERWLTYFDITTPEEKLREVIQMDTAIKRTQELLEFVMQDKESLREYHMREMALSDWTTGVNTAFEKGIEKGIEKGEAKGKIDVAKKSLRNGLSVEIIQKITSLDTETIQSLE